MPKNLNKYLSDKLSAAEILKIFGSIRTARTSPPEIRAGVIRAYDDTMYVMYLPALILCKFFLSSFSEEELRASDYAQVSFPSSLPSLPRTSSWVIPIMSSRTRRSWLVHKMT